MKKLRGFLLLFIFLFNVHIVCAIDETVSGWYGIYVHSDLEEIYGSPISSESYSRIAVQEEYDPGYLRDFWGWQVVSEVEIQNTNGIVSAASQTPGYVGAMVAVGSVKLDLYQPVQALAWTNTQSIYSPSTAQTVDIEFSPDSGFNLAAGYTANLSIYFGIWRNEVTTDNFLLDDKEDWVLSQLNFNGQQYTLLRQTFTSGSYFSSPDPTIWSLDLQTGQDYKFFTYMEAEVVPEPATLLLLSSGVLLLRRRK